MVSCLFRLQEGVLELNFTNDNNQTITSRQTMLFWEAWELNTQGTLFPSTELNIVTISNVLPTGLVGTFVTTAGIIGLCIRIHFLQIDFSLSFERGRTETDHTSNKQNREKRYQIKNQ
jgi:hypothetical protein